MAELVDGNGVTWDIRQPGGDAFTATVAASSRRTYQNRGADVDELAPGTSDATVTWPTGGEPTIVGVGNSVRAVTAFASSASSSAIDRVPASPPANTGRGNVGLIVIVVGGLWLLFGKSSPLKRRPRRG